MNKGGNMAENEKKGLSSSEDFNTAVTALLKGMNTFVSSKTVVGEPVKFDDGTIIVPFVDVSFGVGAGTLNADKKGKAGGGMGGKISPTAVLVIQNGTSRIVSVKNQDTITKVLDMLPDVVDRFKKTPDQKAQEKAVNDKVKEKYQNK